MHIRIFLYNLYVFNKGKVIINAGDGFDRKVDREFKILNELARKILNRNAIGKIQIFTERPPCASCSYGIDDFLAMFPNVEIDILYNNGNTLLPQKNMQINAIK